MITLLPPHEKPYIDEAAQLALIKSRGIEVTNDEEVAAWLKRVGYYRLSAYSYPFRLPKIEQDGTSKRQDEYRPNTKLTEVSTFYSFDKALRTRLADALEQIEIAIRAALVETLGAISPVAYRDARSYRADFSKPDENEDVPLDQFIEGLDNAFERSKGDFARHFRKTYSGPPPVWVAAESWDWGKLSWTLSQLSDANKDLVCKRVNPSLKRKTLVSWMTCLNDVRNACAHHSRLWNRPLINNPSLKQRELALLDDLRSEDGSMPEQIQKRLYGALAVVVILLKSFSKETDWPQEFRLFIQGVNLPSEISINSAGFPENWHEHALWV